MRNGVVLIHSNCDQFLNRIFLSLANRLRDFYGFTKSGTYVTIAVTNNYQIINRADVGGKYQGTWQTGQASWVTVVRKLTPNPSLPKTGY